MGKREASTLQPKRIGVEKRCEFPELNKKKKVLEDWIEMFKKSIFHWDFRHINVKMLSTISISIGFEPKRGKFYRLG